MWLRMIVFLVAAGGLVWFLSSVVQKKEGKVSGEKSNLESILPEPVAKTARVLGEAVARVIPEEVKKTVQETVEEKIIRQTRKTIEESEVVEEIKNTINQAAEEITGFPDKQSKDIKRQVIEQICNDLLEGLENE